MDVDDSTLRRSKCTTKKIYIAFGVIVLVALLVATVTFVLNGHMHNFESETETGQSAVMFRDTRQAPSNEQRISINSPTYMCSIEHPSKEPYVCPYVRHYKHVSTDNNGERYIKLRRNTYSFVDIKAWLKQPKDDSSITRLHCCLLSYVGNLMNMCPGSEQYACYTDDTVDSYTWKPRCGPPKMECKCYRSQIAVCEEDNLPWCTSHTNIEQCRYKTITDGGAQLRCICNTTQSDAPELTECSKLHVSTEINEKRISQDSQNKVCSIELQSSKEPYQCENNYDKYLKSSNGVVYVKYRGKTYHHDDIKALLNQPNDRTDSRRNRTPCCLLSYMGNLMNMCPGSEQFACYMDDTTENYTLKPRCGPPNVKLGCKCYQSRDPICTEDKLPLCHSDTNGTECRHVTVTDDGAHLRCICNTTQQEYSETTLCSKVSSGADKNDVYIDYRRHS